MLEAAGEGTSARLNLQACCDLAAMMVEEFPNVQQVAIPLCEQHGAQQYRWGGMLYDADSFMAHLAPCDEGMEYAPYAIRGEIDLAGGTAFSAGLIYALTTDGLDNAPTAIRFAAAASCLRHTRHGEQGFATRADVEALLQSASDR